MAADVIEKMIDAHAIAYGKNKLTGRNTSLEDRRRNGMRAAIAELAKPENISDAMVRTFEHSFENLGLDDISVKRGIAAALRALAAGTLTEKRDA